MKITNKKKKVEQVNPQSFHGVSKWIKEYRERFCMDLNQLEQTSRQVLAQNDQKSKEHSQNGDPSNDGENEDNDEGGGWTVVSRSLKKTRQRMIPSTEKTLNRLRTKQKRSSEKKELINFYKFQMTDKKIDQLEQLKSKFELDKQRIAQMRQQRKFKPF